MSCNFNGTWNITGYVNEKGKEILSKVDGQIIISDGLTKQCRVSILNIKDHSNVTSWDFETDAADASLIKAESLGGPGCPLDYSVNIDFDTATNPTTIRNTSRLARKAPGDPGITPVDDMGTFTGTKGW